MKKKYDFSKAVKGKFYFPEKELNIPIYLDSKNKKFFNDRAISLGTTTSDLVNKVLNKEIEIAKELQIR
jgi:hypothetical protein